MQWIKTNRSFLDLIPERSGIYMITVENTVVYVGKAKYLQTRIKQHFSDSESNMDLKNIIQHYQVSILYTEVVSESELCRIESALYYQYRPRCNQIAPPRY
ncbi:MAG: GIY-YIG nuclease family protein [Alphaproteobacteria bacterium]|nr:GIY-YIG nuclease family protein [Alphaproteobacteria bacterium]